MDVLEIKKLASMSIDEHLNLFEIEEMFSAAMKVLQREVPSEEECIKYHVNNLHSQLLSPTENAVSIVTEIYRTTINHGLFEEQMNWQEISDAIDDFQYGDNQQGYTADKINGMIISHARKLWHTKISDIQFDRIIGQTVTTIDPEVHFMMQLEKGAIIIECPWRIRNKDGIVIGETDIQSNQRQWKTVKELFVGQTIEDVTLFEQIPLLIVQIGDVFLDVFHASSCFDGWTITNDDDFYIFSMHGGDIA